MLMTWDLLATYALPVLLLAAAAMLFAAWVAWLAEHSRTDPHARNTEGVGLHAVRPLAEGPSLTQPHSRRMLWGIRLAVLAWGTVLAAGAYRLNHNPWRVVMVLGCVLAFLGLWTWLTAAADRRAAASVLAEKECQRQTGCEETAGQTTEVDN